MVGSKHIKSHLLNKSYSFAEESFPRLVKNFGNPKKSEKQVFKWPGKRGRVFHRANNVKNSSENKGDTFYFRFGIFIQSDIKFSN